MKKSLLLLILWIVCCLLAVSCDQGGATGSVTSGDAQTSALSTESDLAQSESAPDESTSEPDESTSAPDESTSEPDESTSEPDESTSEPETEACACTATRTARENEIAATCTEEGSYDEVIYCKDCEKELGRTKKTAAKEDHIYDRTVITDDYLASGATCTEKAAYYYSCKCGEKGTDTFANGDAKGHGYQSVVTKPTCTEKGYTTYTCHCGDSYTADEVEATGHTEVVDAAKEPTCTETGLTEGKHCEACSTPLVVQNVIPAKGHSYSEAWETSETHHWHRAICAHTEEISEHAEHTFGGDLICDACLFEREEDQIIFKTLQVDGTSVYGKASNATASFSFLDEIALRGKATYRLCLDLAGTQTVEGTTVSLSVGDNVFYVIGTVEGNEITYTVTVRRRPTYTVSFDTGGGTRVDSLTVEEDALASVPETSRLGYTFMGWDYDFSAPITEDTEIVAAWTANEYTITYDVNGGDALASHTQTVTYDAPYTLVEPTRKGYDFAGWCLEGVKLENGTWTRTEGISLTASWTPVSYEIYYDLNGGKSENAVSYTVEDAFTLIAPTRTGYTFIGWTFEDQSEPVLSVTIEKGTVGELAYSANWMLNNYTVTYVVNGGNEMSSQSLPYGASLPSAAREGYTFGGWFADVNLTQAVTQVPADEITLYAYWTEETKPCDFSYSFSGSSVSIVAYAANNTEVCIPAYVGGVRVTGIGDAAFEGGTLTSITIPKGIVSIGDAAFAYCERLATVYYGGSANDWNRISIGASNVALTSANRIYGESSGNQTPGGGIELPRDDFFS